MRRKAEAKKYCETCGAQMSRRRYNGRLEDFGVFQRRKYCSLSCANTRKEVTTAGLRWRAEQLRDPACEICGAFSKLHAHHIDGDITNNTSENIQTLCARCHAAHHHYTRRLGLMVAGRAELREYPRVQKIGWTDLNA